MDNKEFMNKMGTLQIEAYNEAIDDIVKTIKILDRTLDKNHTLTISDLLEIINGLKIN